jgi:uncharacterized protein (DUF2235 family)
MAKNIVVLSDGTGQEGGKGHDTNVYKLFRLLEDRTSRQIVFYDEGLGTDWRKFTGNAFGAGFSKNLLQCYRFIFDNYESEDRLYLFGFSRGAATVRSLSSFIHYFGILPKSRPELIEKAYKLYEKGRDTAGANLVGRTLAKIGQKDDEDVLNNQAAEFINEHPNQWANIEFLGVWDTVPALGFVAVAGLNTVLGNFLRYNFHDFRLHPRVQNAYHALAIDDDRLWFHPSLWREKTREEQIVEQVWFSGSHTDIGGGFNESGLSDIAFEWMLERAVNHGLRLYPRARKYWNFVVAPDATDRYHPPRKGAGRFFKQQDRREVWFTQGEGTGEEETASAGFGAPVIHRSVLQRCERSLQDREKESDRNPWILKTTNKKSDPGFQEFLRRKFYDFLKFEWKRYDWVKEKHQEKTFEEWMRKSQYKKYLTSYDWDLLKVHSEDAYKQYCITCWNKKFTPDGRTEWMKKNQYVNKKRLDPSWIESFPPYKAWLKEHTARFDGETYYVEPVRRLDDLLKHMVKDKDVTSVFRDYDEDSLEAVLNQGAPEEINSKFANLLKRGFDKKKRFNRIEYDRRRWNGNDEQYKKHFKVKVQRTPRKKRIIRADV